MYGVCTTEGVTSAVKVLLQGVTYLAKVLHVTKVLPPFLTSKTNRADQPNTNPRGERSTGLTRAANKRSNICSNIQLQYDAVRNHHTRRNLFGEQGLENAHGTATDYD